MRVGNTNSSVFLNRLTEQGQRKIRNEILELLESRTVHENDENRLNDDL